MIRTHTKKINQFKLLVVTTTTLLVTLSLLLVMTNNISANAEENANDQCIISLTKDGSGSICTADGTETTQFVVNSGINYAVSGNCFVMYSDTFSSYDAVWAIPETTTNFSGWTLSTGQSSGKVTENMTVTAHFVNNPGPYTNWGYVAGRILEDDGQTPVVGATVTFLPDPKSNMTDYYGLTDIYGLYYFRVPLNVPGDAIIFAKNHDTLVYKFNEGITSQIYLVDDIKLSKIETVELTASSKDEGHNQFRYFYYVNDKLCWTTYNTTIIDEAKINCYVNIKDNNLVVTWDKIGDATVSEKGVVVPIPKDGYEFTGWTANGQKITPGAIIKAMDFEAHYQPISAPSNPTNSAQTGDNLGIIVVAIIAILGIAGSCFIISRTKNKKNKKN